MSTAVTLNPFQLLRDNEADDPEVISATIKKPEPEAAPAPVPTPEKPKKPVAQGTVLNLLLRCGFRVLRERCLPPQFPRQWLVVHSFSERNRM